LGSKNTATLLEGPKIEVSNQRGADRAERRQIEQPAKMEVEAPCRVTNVISEVFPPSRLTLRAPDMNRRKQK
jgi:hypothetical protein